MKPIERPLHFQFTGYDLDYDISRRQGVRMNYENVWNFFNLRNIYEFDGYTDDSFGVFCKKSKQIYLDRY